MSRFLNILMLCSLAIVGSLSVSCSRENGNDSSLHEVSAQAVRSLLLEYYETMAKEDHVKLAVLESQINASIKESPTKFSDGLSLLINKDIRSVHAGYFWIKSLKPNQITPALKQSLLESLKNRYYESYEICGEYLGSAAIPLLLVGAKVEMQNNENYNASRALRGLGLTKDAKAFPLLSEALSKENGFANWHSVKFYKEMDIFFGAAEGLGLFGSKDAENLLIEQFDKHKIAMEGYRLGYFFTVMKAMGHIGLPSSDTVNRIYSEFKKENQFNTALVAGRSLGEIYRRSPKLVPDFLEVLAQVEKHYTGPSFGETNIRTFKEFAEEVRK